MKIIIFGASGKTGTLLVQQALSAGHHVTAYVRKASSVTIEHPELEVVVGNLNDTQKLKDVISGADVCISALGGGSLTKRTPELVEGIANIVTTMENAGIQRFIYLSSIGAGESRFLMAQPIRFLIVSLFLRVPLADHNANEKRIAESKLNWTFVRPGGLTDGALNESPKFGFDITPMTGNRSISRASVASFILKQISNENLFRKAVWLYE